MDVRDKILLGQHPLKGWIVSNPLDDIVYEIEFVADGVAFVTEVGVGLVYYAIPLNAMKAGDTWFELFPHLEALRTRNETRYPQKAVPR